jgi:hypothetical protein
VRLPQALRDAAATQGAQVKYQVRAAVRQLVILLVVALLLVCALLFLMTGAYHSLNETLPAWQAGGLVALGAIGAALLFLALTSLGGRQPRPRPRIRRGEASTADRDAQEALAEVAGDFLRDNRPTGLDLTLAAFLVGLITSRSRSRRSD